MMVAIEAHSVARLSLHGSHQPLVAFHAQNGESSVLAGFGQTEEHRPQNAFRCNADRQEHLGKGKNIEWDAAQQDDDSRAESQRLQPLLHLLKALNDGSISHFSLLTYHFSLVTYHFSFIL
jgi:hypothetical protein